MRRRRPVGSADEVLIRGLFAEHGAGLLAYATRLSGDRAAGAEVVRETLLRAWCDPRVAAGAGAARAHLFAVVREVAAERRGEPVAAGPTVDSSAVLAAVRTLAPEQREVLHAVFFQGRDIAATAADLGVPEATVRARASCALRRLRDVLGPARPLSPPSAAPLSSVEPASASRPPGGTGSSPGATGSSPAGTGSSPAGAGSSPAATRSSLAAPGSSPAVTGESAG